MLKRSKGGSLSLAALWAAAENKGREPGRERQRPAFDAFFSTNALHDCRACRGMMERRSRPSRRDSLERVRPQAYLQKAPDASNYVANHWDGRLEVREHGPSRTAIGVAIRRAAHQVLDTPRIFDDPLALPILGPLADCVSGVSDNPVLRNLRLFLAVRSRFAEDELARAVAGGTRQYVLLGAGLDTFAYRNPRADLRVFEVDHPGTQDWKRAQLERAGIAIPANTVHVPVDFERQTLARELAGAGFQTGLSAFFAWLGVVPYLTDEAFESTLRFIAAMRAGSGVVFDYGAKLSGLNVVERAARSVIAKRVAAAGEPFRLFFDPAELVGRLTALGFRKIEDLGSQEINQRYSAGLRGNSGRLLVAWL